MRFTFMTPRFRSACVFLTALSVCVGTWLAACHSARADLEGPDFQDRNVALAVRMLLVQKHLTGQSLNDEMSRRCLDTYLKNLDPFKLYFYQSDIDRFETMKNQLDDQFRDRDMGFAYDVFRVFLQRVDERTALAQELLDEKPDFTVDEEMIRDRDAAVYPKSPEEARERWRKRVKFDLMREIADDVEYDEAVKKLRKRYESFRKYKHLTDDDELLELYISAITSAFDPHSNYMSKSTLENFHIQMKLELDGIGASLRQVDGYTEVQEVIAGGAADLDKRLKKGDRIIGVGQGTEGEIVDVVDMKLNDVVKLIRGKRDTVVRLEVNPVDNPNSREIYDITRARIELKNAEARGEVLEFGTGRDGTPLRIGVIQLPSFYMDMDGAALELPSFKSATRDVRRSLEKFNREDVDVVVMDLRWNGGGSLTESVNMTGLFIDRGPVVQVKGPDGRTVVYDDREPGMVWSGPLVVVTNHLSASASEIFAGAIQDYGRGVVIGDESTHGKGTVQQLFDLGNWLISKRNELGALKLTIQQFYRASGDSTQNRGVLSDVELPSLTTHWEVGESDWDYALPFDQVRPLPHDVYHMVDAQVLDDLRQRSGSRVNASDYFARQERRIRRYEEQKDSETITLNLEKFVKEREDLDAEKEEEDMIEEQSSSERPVFKMDDYGKEILNITADYVHVLGQNKIAVADQTSQAAVTP